MRWSDEPTRTACGRCQRHGIGWVGPVIAVAVVLALPPGAGRGRAFADDAKYREAQLIFKEMGLTPSSRDKRYFRALYVGPDDFAEARLRSIQSMRGNFLGFMRRLNVPIKPDHEQLLVLLFDTQEQMQRFMRLSSDKKLPDWVAGYYDPAHNWSVFYNQRGGKDLVATQNQFNAMAQHLLDLPGGPDVIIEVNTPNGRVRKSKRQVAAEMEAEWARILKQVSDYNVVVTQHEGAHQLAFNVGLQHRGARYPFWLSEGLACVFEVPPDELHGRLGASKINRDRLADYRQLKRNGRAWNIEKLVRFDETENVDVNARYAESWALFAFLFQRYPKELGRYMTYLAKTDAEARPDDPYQEFKQFFSEPADRLQQQLDRYIDGL